MKAKTSFPPWRAAFSALIVRAMRRDGIKEITTWTDHHDISRSTYYNAVNGRIAKSGEWIKPSIDTLAEFARAFQMPTHELLYLIAPDVPGAPGSRTLEPPL